MSVHELIELVRAAARIPVRHEVDPARVRAHDVPEVRGSAERLRAATGWRPEIPLEQHRRRRARGVAGGARGHAVTAARSRSSWSPTTAPATSRDTLGALVPQLRDGDELIVVDNGSRDATAAAVRAAAPQAWIVEQDNRGFAGGAAPARRWPPRTAAVPQPGRAAGAGCLDELRRVAGERPDWGAWQALVTMEGGHTHQHRRQRHALPGDGLGGTLRPAGRPTRPREPDEVVLRLGRRAGRCGARPGSASAGSTSATSCTARTSTCGCGSGSAGFGGGDRAGGAGRARLRLREGRAQVVPARAQSLVDDPGRLPGPPAGPARPGAAGRRAGACSWSRHGAAGWAPEAALPGRRGARAARDAGPAPGGPGDAA